MCRLTVLDLREEPRLPPTETITVFEPDGDPLPAQLRACAAMGELALSTPDCHAAWAEKRRRFLGVEAEAQPSDLSVPITPDVPAIDQSPATKAN